MVLWPVKIANKTLFLFYGKIWYEEDANINVRNQSISEAISFHLILAAQLIPILLRLICQGRMLPSWFQMTGECFI